MAKGPDRLAFLADPTRLRIAEWCAKEPLSREEIARRLGRPSGGLSQPDTMLKHKALKRAGFVPKGGGGRKAELLCLNPTWQTALDEALKAPEGATAGVLEPDTDLLLIPLAGTETACRVILSGELRLRWGARLDGEQMGLLLSPEPDELDRAMIRAVAELERAGVHAVRVRLRSIMAPSDLLAWAGAIAADERRELVPRT